MPLRRSARVSAISRPSISTSTEDQTARKVEPSKVTKRGKGGRNSRPLKPVAGSSPSTPKQRQMGVPINTLHKSGAARSGSPLVSANRPADPHQTNAPLLSPETSRVVTYTDELISSGTTVARPLSTKTTENILEEACAHLINVDPALKHVIDKHRCPLFSPEGLAEKIDPFVTLSSSIISQQVSGQAARSIKRKFILLFNDDAAAGSDGDLSEFFPAPSQVATCDLATLRTAGLSGRKAEYIQGLAQKFASGELSTEMLINASDEEVLEKLIAVRGLGKWSVEMFSCFGLKRMDIFSTGDLGVQRGVATYMGKDVSKMKAKGGGKWKYMSEKDMLEIAAKFAPYRSLFMWYMWKIQNVDVEAMQS